MNQEVALGLGFGLTTVGLVAAGHALASGRVPVFGRLPFWGCALVLVALGALTASAALPAAAGGDGAVSGALLLLGSVVVMPVALAALVVLPVVARGLRAYAGWWVAAVGMAGPGAFGAVAVVQALAPAAGDSPWWALLEPRSPLSYAVAAASVFALLRGTTELVRFIGATRAVYLPQRLHPATRLGGVYYPMLTVACGAVALLVAAGIALTMADQGDRASLPVLLLRSVPTVAALGLAAFFARFVTAAEPTARVFTVLCLLFAVASNQVAPPQWGAAADSLRFAALIAAAPVTLHFALVFPHQDEALTRTIATHWSWRLLFGVQVPWLVYLPLTVCLPVAASLPMLQQMPDPPVAMLGLLAGTYLMTSLAPTASAYAFARTWHSLRADAGAPDAVQRVRVQLAWVALGGLLAAVGSVVWTLLGPWLAAAFSTWAPTVYWACALLLPLGVAPAIVRHGLWDVQRLLNYALVHALTLAVVGLAESALLGAADGLIKGTLEDLQLPDYFGRGAALLAAAAVYNPLKTQVKKYVDRIFARWLRWPAGSSR